MNSPHKTLAEEAESAIRLAIDQHCPEAWAEELHGCTRQLATLLDEFHDRPMDDWRATVHEIVRERCQLDEGGDSVLHDDEMLADHVRFIIREMERVRCHWVHRGECSSEPAPPPMCG